MINREVSWLAFNDRVLEEALDPSNPPLERLRFLTIFHTNLDEFFMIRVSGLIQQVAADVDVLSSDGLTPRAQLGRILDITRRALQEADDCLTQTLRPLLEEHHIRVCHYAQLDTDQRTYWNDWYKRNIHPILTPLAVSPTLPFPFISSLSLNLAVNVTSPNGDTRLVRLKVPGRLPRLVPFPDNGEESGWQFLLVDELIAANLATLFPGMEVGNAYPFRVTRDADIEIKEDEANDLLKCIEEELRRRRFGEAVRLEVHRDMPSDLRKALKVGLGLDKNSTFEAGPILDVSGLSQLVSLDLPDLKYPSHVPRKADSWAADVFASIRRQDLLVHHPFESFKPVVDFIRAAAADPDVLAIKQTLYRTSGDSPVIRALECAIENGKQVAAVVELKARFDEENNIVWARRLEEAGVHVIYGVPGLKTHSKIALVVRQEEGVLRRYCHIGTGNYNPTTSRIYTDLGLFTCHPRVTADVADLFNQITGFARPSGYRELLVAPRFVHKQLLELIAFETAQARAGRPGQVVFKCNAITEPKVIEALYAASQAGVQVDLIVRGICCLVPGKAGLSENITVRSIVGRFLEHSRVYWFRHGDTPKVYIGSADLMDRNLKHRVEVLTPVLHPPYTSWLKDVLLDTYVHDLERTRVMRPDGSYFRLREHEHGLDSQLAMMSAFPPKPMGNDR